MPVAVITGASGPIGQAIAKAFRERGYELILHSHEGDLSKPDEQDRFCDEIRSRTSHVDVLVHNAASYDENAFRGLDLATWNSTIGLNAEAPLFMTQALLPLLEKSDAPCVIHVTDAMSERVRTKHFAYTASKAMLTQLTRALAVELAPKIRVNAVAPGVLASSSDVSSSVLEKIPLKRFATPDDIAKAVTFLACDATYATGETLVIDGGRSLV